MNVCICGWYFKKAVYDAVREHEVFTVKHQEGDTFGIPSTLIENIGLEFGAYDWYLKNVWKGGKVLFMHDDLKIDPVIKNFEIMNPSVTFDELAKLDGDLVFVFKNEVDRKRNCEVHGRMFLASEKFLSLLLSMNNGFSFDKNNTGYTSGAKPDSCDHYNWAIMQLKEFADIQKLSGIKVQTAFVPSLNFEVRGVGH